MRKVLLLLFFFLIYANVLADYPAWTQYTSGYRTSCLLEDGDDVWIGTSGGLVKMDINTEEMVFYNNANSGLPDNKINCLAKYKNKILIGTDYGFATYENGSWEVFDTQNSELNSNFISCFFIDGDEIWLGSTPFGITKIINDEWTFYDVMQLSGLLGSVGCIAKDKDKNIWVGGNWGDILKFDGIEWINYRDSVALQIDGMYHISSCRSIILDSNENIWFGGIGFGILKFDGIHWQLYTEYPRSDPWYVNKLFLDSNQTIWASGYGFGSFIPGKQSWKFKYYSGTDFINDFIFDKFGNVWFADKFYGIIKYSKNGELKKINPSNSIFKYNYISSVATEDRTVWIGTQYEGFITFTDDEWELIQNDKFDLSSIKKIAIDKNGIKWLAEEFNGLLKFDNNNIERFTKDNTSLIADDVNDITFDKDNNVWIATREGGVGKYNGIYWKVFDTTYTPLKTNDITFISIDELNNKWIGTYGYGVYKYNDVDWVQYDTSSGLPSNKITGIKVINNKDIWIGTKSGLVNYKDDKWIVYNKLNSNIPEEEINNLELDQQNNVWFNIWGNPTDKRGLVKFDGTNFELFTKSNSGLPSNNINSIAFDSTDNLWIGTDNGLARFKYLTTGIEENESNTSVELVISPNPANEFIDIKINKPPPTSRLNQFGEIRIYNIIGELVLTSKIHAMTSSHRINIEDLTSGVYFFKICTDSDCITKQLVIYK